MDFVPIPRAPKSGHMEELQAEWAILTVVVEPSQSRRYSNSIKRTRVFCPFPSSRMISLRRECGVESQCSFDECAGTIMRTTALVILLSEGVGVGVVATRLKNTSTRIYSATKANRTLTFPPF